MKKMAQTPSTQGTVPSAHTPINVYRLAMWKITPASGSTAESYGSVIDFDKRFMTFTDSLNIASGNLYGCGELTTVVRRPATGNLALAIHALKASERSDILGETVSSDVATLKGKGDIAPYMVVAVAEELDDGHLNLYKYYKAQFSQGDISVQQSADGVNFSTTSLNGTYFRNGTVGKMRDIKFDVDPNSDEGSAALETWFTTAVPS